MNRVISVSIFIFSAVLTYGQQQRAPKVEGKSKLKQQGADTIIKKSKPQLHADIDSGKRILNKKQSQFKTDIKKIPGGVKSDFQSIKQNGQTVNTKVAEIKHSVAADKNKLSSIGNVKSIDSSMALQKKEFQNKISIATKSAVTGYTQQATSKLKDVTTISNDSLVKKEIERQKADVKSKLKNEKEQLKDVVKQANKPIDFDIKIDNNGSSAKSDQFNNAKNAVDHAKKMGWSNPKVNSHNGLKLPSVPDQPGTLSKSSILSPASLTSSQTKGAALSPYPSNTTGALFKTTQHKMDSLSKLNAASFSGKLPNFAGSKTVYSEKRLQHLKDSMGGKKFDSLYHKGKFLMNKKEIGKDDLLKSINNPIANKLAEPKNKLDQKSIVGEAKNQTESSFKELDLQTVQLPRTELERLQPLSGNVMDSKYLKIVDSLRHKRLKQQDLSLLEKKLADGHSEAIFRKKPKFWDKTYFDGILGVLGGEKISIAQFSPSLGYHILPTLSLGVGPIISLQQNKDLNATFGVRSFAKLEVCKQRGYFQVEHQLNPRSVDYKNLNLSSGSILVGGGLVKKIYNNIAVNISLLHRVYTTTETPGASPWVFRLGVSTISSKDTQLKK